MTVAIGASARHLVDPDAQAGIIQNMANDIRHNDDKS